MADARPDIAHLAFSETKEGHKLVSAEGIACIVNKHEPAKFEISFKKVPSTSPYWVLYTDYENLAIVYSCTSSWFHYQEKVWILGRSSKLSHRKIHFAFDFLKEAGINTKCLIAADQSCSKITPYSPYWVLSTDYSNYTIVYSCTDVLRVFHVEFAWILSRAPSLAPAQLQSAKDLLVSEGIGVSGMKPTDQSCRD
ncbi:unnamed protein product [Menidia menidia]|uniref:(Atlantic silverside) hypothetical protein n=1 Tax=Menidia menidia TaxID=238744 RepID=A0A8S4AEM7_9TELE|nr:unnamed protein product [Menidia menidia]